MIWPHFILIALLLLAVVCDLRSREIPDWISVAIVVLAAIALLLNVSGIHWLSATGGAAAALIVGLMMFGLAGFGGGDVKLLFALGAYFGVSGFLSVLFWMAMAGGVIALIAAAQGKRDLAYGPAIAIGSVVYLSCPTLLQQLLLG